MSNRCATSPAVRFRARRRAFVTAIQLVAAIALTAELVRAQEAPAQPSTHSGNSNASDVGSFLLGGGVGLVAHESGHLLFDAIFNAHAGVQKVSFHGIPFFAITHDPTISRRREFVIDSAGFWVQEGTNEWLLHQRPNLRHEHAPFVKGVFAFNVLASVAYAGAAFARTGPVERDTRGMAASLNWHEPAVGVLILVPAMLDAVRYYRPDAHWATWGSRTAKLAGVVLVFK
jgi:hypothetical protein